MVKFNAKLHENYVYFTREPFEVFQSKRKDTGKFMMFSPSYGALIAFAKKHIGTGLIDGCKVKSKLANIGNEYVLDIFAENQLMGSLLLDKVREWNEQNDKERIIKVNRKFWKSHEETEKGIYSERHLRELNQNIK